MLRFALVISLFVPCLASAQEAPSGNLCLSDGQTLSGVRIAQDGAHRTVRIGDDDVRVPDDAVAADCPAMHVAPTADPFALRTVKLVDGQTLYGTPMYSPGQMTLALLDENVIHLPDATVAGVERLERGPEALEPVHQQRSRTQMKKALGIAETVGLGMLGAAAVAGTTWGIVEASSPNP